MSPGGHTAVSGCAGVAVAAATGHPGAGVACFLAGIFIDVDHVLDYFWTAGVKVDVRDFLETCEKTRFDRLLLLLHSWELLALAWLAQILFPHAVVLGALVGLTLHLIADQLFNEPFPLTYFLAYRIRVRLDAARLFKPVSRRRIEAQEAASLA